LAARFFPISASDARMTPTETDTQNAPSAPRYVARWLTLCPHCLGLVRRDLDVPDAPWTCDLHGTVQPVQELWEVPTGEEAA
jgi:hypothetical protein